ncbi:arsenate reductase ArsC [Massilia timonae]|uniref:Low molecular weight phosphotyrosine phosphatase family protein n=1 Tax=Massilia timonae TaxID=47229 RepID=A0A1S2NAX8_9BURK|nr:arsenate reductase ArsC [Massilia timonae]OIJ41502.1 low molecular weight phosphotyrosine phosphatase family protein [Massilia timonae]
MNFLFLCTGNSCRSILSEAVFNHLAPAGFKAISAGSHPTGRINPDAIALLRRHGIAVDGHASKSWHHLPLTPDVVVTVCGNAAGETCPAYLGDVVRTHWGLADPSEVQGTPADIAAAFEATYAIVLARIQALFALPLAELAGERAALEEALDRIGAC